MTMAQIPLRVDMDLLLTKTTHVFRIAVVYARGHSVCTIVRDLHQNAHRMASFAD